MNIWRRLRGALGFGVLGAVGFHLIGWLVVGFEAIAAGTWPSLTTIMRMTLFTVPVGGTVGLLSAGAIALGAGSSKIITEGRAVLVGLPLGALGGLVMARGLPLGDLLFVSGSVGMATALVGAAAVAVARRVIGAGEAPPDALPSSGRESNA